MPPKRKSPGKTSLRSVKVSKKQEHDEPIEENDLGFVFTRQTKNTRTTKTVRKNISVKHRKSNIKPPLKEIKATITTPHISKRTSDVTNESEDEFVQYITPSKPTRSLGNTKKRLYKSLAPTTFSKMAFEKTRYSEAFIPLPKNEALSDKKLDEVRKKKRRSSFARRGKRASSIGSGFIALPHPSIRTEELYRHISPEVSDPIRMKQLLIWCARRAMDSQRSRGDPEAFQIAKSIQENIISMLVNNQVNTSWYHRKVDDESKDHSMLKLEHPQNLDNIKKKREYEEQISRLQSEDKHWIDLIKKYNRYHADIVDRHPLPSTSPQAIPISPDLCDEYLNEKMFRFLRSIDVTKHRTTETEDIDQIEYKIDRLHHILYIASQFSQLSQEFSTKIFSKAIRALNRLPETQTSNLQSISVEPLDLLRTFSRVKKD